MEGRVERKREGQMREKEVGEAEKDREERKKAGEAKNKTKKCRKEEWASLV